MSSRRGGGRGRWSGVAALVFTVGAGGLGGGAVVSCAGSASSHPPTGHVASAGSERVRPPVVPPAGGSGATAGPTIPSTGLVAPPPDDRVGIVLGNAFNDPADVERTLTDLAAVGCGWVRADFDWPSIEPERGTFDWTDTDRFVALAARHHVRVLALLAYTPAWARPKGSSDKHPPTDAADYARFAAEAATRYRHATVGAWEIWNEPNSASFWQPKPDTKGYLNLLRAASATIRAADPDATIVTGGLAPAVDTRNRSEMSPETFLARLLAAGASDSFDAVGSHPYSYPALPSDETTAAWNSFYRLPELHAKLESAGFGDRPIWITEVGAPTGTSDRAVSPEHQAEILGDALTTARSLPWVAHTFVYSYQDRSDDDTDPEANFGLRRADGSTKPAWDTFVGLLRH